MHCSLGKAFDTICHVLAVIFILTGFFNFPMLVLITFVEFIEQKRHCYDTQHMFRLPGKWYVAIQRCVSFCVI